MRRLIYHVACSADGLIARPDGALDGFLDGDGDHVADFLTTYEWFDTVLMGRKTYEVGLRAGITSPYPQMRQYVFSRTIRHTPDENVHLVSGDAQQLVARMKEEEGKAIWLCGGADLAGTLFRAGLIDEVMLKVNPLLLGTGIPQFAGAIAPTRLQLTDCKRYESGVVRLRYDVGAGP
jgi:dihydrofolate reductase